MKNKFGFVGLLSLLGFVGVFTEHRWFMTYFILVAYFSYFRVIPDEMFRDMVKKCAAAAFFVNLAVTSVAMLVFWLVGMDEIVLSANGIGWTAAFATFFFTFPILEIRERRNASKNS